MAAVGKDRQLVQIIGEPMGVAGQMHEAIFDRRGLGMKPHDLVAVRFVARDLGKAGLNELLDELRSRRFVLDQDDRGVEHTMLFVDGPFEVRKGELLAQDIQEIDMGACNARLSALTGNLGRLSINSAKSRAR